MLHHGWNACCYDFRNTTAPSISYTSGTHLVVADTLSRTFSPREIPSTAEEDVQIHVCAVNAELPVSKRKWNKNRKVRSHQQVIRSINDDPKTCPNPYATFVEVMAVVDGVLLKGQQIVIPTNMPPEMRSLVNERRAREVIYWPNMNTVVYDFVSRCDICRKHLYAQEQPLLSPERPYRPWSKVGCDISTWNRSRTFSRSTSSHIIHRQYCWQVKQVDKLLSTSSRFSRYGIPSSDVRRRSAILQCRVSMICRGIGLYGHMSSPYYPQSNGLAENGVKIVKRLLTKAAEKGNDPYLAMLTYRCTCRQRKSPA